MPALSRLCIIQLRVGLSQCVHLCHGVRTAFTLSPFPLCLSGLKRGVCSQINHFPEDADYDHDGAEYVLRKRGINLTIGNYIMGLGVTSTQVGWGNVWEGV